MDRAVLIASGRELVRMVWFVESTSTRGIVKPKNIKGGGELTVDIHEVHHLLSSDTPFVLSPKIHQCREVRRAK